MESPLLTDDKYLDPPKVDEKKAKLGQKIIIGGIATGTIAAVAMPFMGIPVSNRSYYRHVYNNS